MSELIKVSIEHLVFIIRGRKVMLDRDLAKLYQVSTKALNQAVRRNPGRFPKDFVFRLTIKEKMELVTNCDRFDTLKYSDNPPYAFTRDGVSMLSSVLKSERAVLVNVQIMRAFGRLMEMADYYEELARKLDALEKKYDSQFKIIFDAIRGLMNSPQTAPESRLIPVPKVRGFTAKSNLSQ